MGVDYEGVLTDLDTAISQKEGQAQAIWKAQAKPRGRVRLILTPVCLVAVLVGAVLVWAPILRRRNAVEPVHALGRVVEDPKVAACVRGLWEVRAAMDRYVASHGGRPPARLEDLGAPKLLVCPATHAPWRFEIHADGSYLVACPDPARLACSAVFIDQRFGPPQVVRPGEEAPSP